ncbi:hypothetical protein chiPu_0027955, partial [Chiloscyllium punctatum]|nr:hypothetical protein [Chiloscyllium punctatum]
MKVDQKLIRAVWRIFQRIGEVMMQMGFFQPCLSQQSLSRVTGRLP